MVTQLFLISFTVSILGFAGVFYLDGLAGEISALPAAVGLVSCVVLAFLAAKSGT